MNPIRLARWAPVLACAFLLVPGGAAARANQAPRFPRSLEPDWSPDGRTIVFISDRGDGDYHLFVMNANGKAQRRLTGTRDGERNPSWSPDGTKIAFAAGGDIEVVDADGGNARRLTAGGQGAAHDPDWSPDGRQLVFIRELDDDNGQLFVINADGTGERRLVFDDQDDVQPAWSPDGKRIAFVGGPHDEAYIDVVAADGSKRVRLTTDGHAWRPAWSPDGRQLLFTHGVGEDDVGDVYVMNADGSGQRKLVGGRRHEDMAAFAPDGKRIAYASDATGEPQVYTPTAAGKAAKRLTGLPRVLTSLGDRCNVVGTARPDVLRGGGGRDVICGLGGNDRIVGGRGDDELDGGAGDDLVTGGPGVDVLLGGPGADTFFAAGDGRRDRVDGGGGRDRAHVDLGDWVSFVELISF